MLGQLNATLEEENKALVEQINKLVEQVNVPLRDLQSRTIIIGTFDTSEDGTPSPVQCCTNRWLFGQKIAHFLVFSTLQRGEGGEVGQVSQDY